MNNKLTITEKREKYLKENPFFEDYRGWTIRMCELDDKYFGPQKFYRVDVRIGVETCLASTLDFAHEFIDKKIKEGKIQESI